MRCLTNTYIHTYKHTHTPVLGRTALPTQCVALQTVSDHVLPVIRTGARVLAVCMYVCVLVGMYVCVCMDARVRTRYVCICICAHMYVSPTLMVCTHVYLSMHVDTCVCNTQQVRVNCCVLCNT
jgi:hypothetical protein